MSPAGPARYPGDYDRARAQNEAALSYLRYLQSLRPPAPAETPKKAPKPAPRPTPLPTPRVIVAAEPPDIRVAYQADFDPNGRAWSDAPDPYSSKAVPRRHAHPGVVY